MTAVARRDTRKDQLSRSADVAFTRVRQSSWARHESHAPWKSGDLPGIVGRGRKRRALFAAADDRRFFVEGLGRVFVPGDVDLLGWALHINQYRLLIRVTDAPRLTLFRRPRA